MMIVENGLVYRYDTAKIDDGTGGGEEGAFSMCTLWLIESYVSIYTTLQFPFPPKIQVFFFYFVVPANSISNPTN